MQDDASNTGASPDRVPDRVTVIGAGLVGRAWTISFARAGCDTVIWDADPEAGAAALDFIAGILPELAARDLLSGRSPEQVLGAIRIETDLGQALEGARHVQENTPERLEVKREVFARLDALAPPEATLASSSSALLPSRISEHVPGRARCLVAHPINPPYLVPAVEVVPAPWTDPAAVTRVADLMRRCGQAPIVMQKELDGFIMNRLQGALLEEAFRLVDSGYASAEDVDIGLREGLALRWSFMGPFETIDLNAPGGVRDYVARYEGIYDRLFGDPPARAAWNGPVLDRVEADRRARLPADALAERHRWRDLRLMALTAHKRQAAREIGD